MPLTGNQVPANQAFQIAADHTGVNVVDFRLFINGVAQVAKPVAQMVGGSIVFDVNSPLGAGPHTLAIGARNSSGESVTEYVVEAVPVPPAPVTNVRVVHPA